MADSGFNWGSWAAMQKSESAWTSDDLTDTSTETGDEVDLDGKAACEVGIEAVEDNTGAIDGVVTVYILGSVNADPDFEGTAQASYALTFEPVQNDTVYKRFSVDPARFGSFKVAIENQAGQTLSMSVTVRTATIPPAS